MICTLCGEDRMRANCSGGYDVIGTQVCSQCVSIYAEIKGQYKGDTDHRKLTMETSKMRNHYRKNKLGGY